MKDGDPCGEERDEFEIMFDDDDRRALIEVLDELDRLQHLLPRHSRRRLIEQCERWAGRQQHAELNPLPMCVGQLVHPTGRA